MTFTFKMYKRNYIMKFDERYKQIIFEWQNQQYHTVCFSYTYDNMQLIPDSPLRFSVELRAKYLYQPGEPATYDDPPGEGDFEFQDIVEFVHVEVYNEETNEIDYFSKKDGNVEDIFEKKYPEAYKIFAEHYCDEPSEDVFNPYDHEDEIDNCDDPAVYDYNYKDYDH